MRLERLDLVRYGHFTDFSLNLGEKPGTADFHLVYGANEAGKSTIRNAYLDLLYGISARTPYNFKHPNEALEVGASFIFDDARHNFVRVRKNKQSLLGADRNPVSEAGLAAALGGIGREAYCNMFSLDEHSLQEGGESILRSEGDLGELLFSAAAGMSGLSAALEGVRDEADGYYKARARSHRLAVGKAKLRDLDVEIRERDLQASAYDALVKDEAGKRAAYDQAKSERDRDANRAVRLHALLEAYEAWREHDAHAADWDALKHTPDLPDGWLEEAEEMSRRSAAMEAKKTTADETIIAAQEAIDQIPNDPTILSLSKDIERLTGEDLEARYRAAKDIAQRERDRTVAASAVSNALKQLGQPEGTEPEALMLTAAEEGRLTELMEQRGTFEAAHQAAEEDQARARARLQKAQTDLGAFKDLLDLAMLAARVTAIRADYDAGELRRAERDVVAAQSALDVAMARLKPWRGDVAGIVALNPPDHGRIDSLKAEDRAIAEERAALNRERQRLTNEKALYDAEIRTRRAVDGVIDDAAADAARKARDEAWVAHVALIDGDPLADQKPLQDSAAGFTAAMVTDDRIRENRARHATEVAALRTATIEASKRATELQNADANERALDERAGKNVSAVAALMQDLGLPDDTLLSTIDGWLDRRGETLAAATALTSAKSARSEHLARRDQAMKVLRPAMTDAGIDVDGSELDDWLTDCDTALAEWSERNAAKQEAERRLEDARDEEQASAARLKRAAAELDTWGKAWSQTLQASWIGASAPAASSAQAAEILKVLARLASDTNAMRQLEARIQSMTEDRAAFTEEVRRLAHAAEAPFDADDPLITADALRERLRTAEENEIRRKGRLTELETAKAGRKKAMNDLNAEAARFADMTAVFQADDWKHLLAAMRRSQDKERLSIDIDRLERRIVSTLNASDFTAAAALLQDELGTPAQVEEVRAEHHRLGADAEAVAAHVTELFHDWKTAEKALSSVAGDAEVARLEEQKRATLLAIEDDARTFLRLAAGVMVVDRALVAYRDVHRSAMMRQASEAFAAITRGAFAGLSAVPGKDSEVLVGVRSSGGSILASEMSRGTRFQLFLALRVAGHSEFSKQRGALPFFADDIMEPFDDDRTAETFSLLQQMATRGQVVYFTHHRHLCGIAKDVCEGNVAIHDLP